MHDYLLLCFNDTTLIESRVIVFKKVGTDHCYLYDMKCVCYCMLIVWCNALKSLLRMITAQVNKADFHLALQ